MESINIYAKYENTNYDFLSIQKNVTSAIKLGWPDKTFSMLPVYNVDDEIKLRIDDVADPCYLIPNSDWDIHYSQITGNTLTCYDLSVFTAESINEESQFDNFCFITSSLAFLLNKDIGDTINISSNNGNFVCIIRNIILEENSTGHGLKKVFGNNYIVVEQSLLSNEIKKDICICDFRFNNHSTFLELLSFKSLVNSNNARYYIQKKYINKKLIVDSEDKILSIFNSNPSDNLIYPLTFLTLSVILFLVSVFIGKKTNFYDKPKNLLHYSCTTFLTASIFLIIFLAKKDIKFFSFNFLLVLLSEFIVNSIFFCFCIKTKKLPIQ